MQDQIQERPLRDRLADQVAEQTAKANEARAAAKKAGTFAADQEKNAAETGAAAARAEESASRGRAAEAQYTNEAANARSAELRFNTVADRAEADANQLRKMMATEWPEVGEEHASPTPLHDQVAATHGPSTTSPFVPVDGRSGGRQ